MKSESRICQYCGEPIRGRSDKKFCDDQCRSNYNYRLQREGQLWVRKVNLILKKNRKILEELMGKEKMKKVPIQTLLEKGYMPRFYTHVLTSAKGTYHFCYEYGYIELDPKGVLIVRNVDMLK